MNLIYTVIFVATIFLLFHSAKMIRFKKQGKGGNRGAPGPWNLPLLGSLHVMLGSNLPHHVFHDLSTVYGPVMSIKLGEKHVVVVSSAEAAREIMKTQDIIFATRPVNRAIDVLFYGGNDILFAPYGEFWRQMRRICNLELFTTKRVQSFRGIREEEVSQLIRSIAASSAAVVDLSRKLSEVTNNIMTRVVIGGRCDDQKLFFSALDIVVEFVSGFTVVDLFPSFPFIGRITGFEQRLQQCKKKLDLIVERILQEHIEKMAKDSAIDDNNEKLSMANDLTDVLLSIQREGGLQFQLSNDNVKAVVNDLLLAGSETTTTLMEWTMSELLRNPDIMKKAQKEIREVIGSTTMKEKLVEEELTSGRLPYLQLVIKEALRLHPPVPLLLPRENQESCEVMGYEIPAKTRVIINMWAVARDAKYWDNPDVFWPERFENSCIDFKGAHFEFTPFGSGRRMCPAMQFGLASVEIILANLLYYFDWEILEEKLDMEEDFGITARRKSPLCVVPTLHVSLPASA